MLERDYDELLVQLHDRTIAGDVNWAPTPRGNEFLVVFQGFSLSLREDASNERIDYGLTLRNETGKAIDEFWIGNEHELYLRVRELYTAARRRALRIDEALKVILAELRSSKAVGQPVPEAWAKVEKDDKDVPF
jgi:hypothetical protein